MKRYRRVTDGSERIPNNLVAGMLQLLHSKNPDLEPLYAEVVSWYVEVDGSRVVREVGFAADGVAILAAPMDDNPGTWAILTFNFDDSIGVPVDAESFHRCWDEAVVRVSPLIRSRPKREPP